MENEKNQVTTENAPLFLVMEETKKTMKLVYVDTADHVSDKIFQDAGLKVKRLNEEASDDDRYVYTGCRISKRDMDKFRECMDLLERKLLLTGYHDYREWSMAALIELIEGQVNASGFHVGNDEGEYPKSLFIPFIPQDSLPDALLACYSLTKTATFHPEVLVFNSNPEEQRDGYIFPADAFALVLRKDTPISFDAFRKTYLKHRSGISCITSLDEKDTQRVSVMMLPDEAYEKNDIPRTPVITIYDKETEAKLSAFLMDWDEQYQEVKKA